MERPPMLPAPADVLSALPVPVLVLERGGGPVEANPAAEMLFGRSEEMLREKGWDGILPPDSPLRALIAEAESKEQPLAAYDVAVGMIDRPGFVADVLIEPLGGFHTLALQRRSVAAMVERLAEQRGAVRSASAIGAMLAHEIKNPLSGIRGAAQLLGGDEREELSRLIIAEVDRVSALIDRMERFTDTRPPERRPVNIHSVLSHVRALAAAGAAAGLTIAERYDPSLPPVAADRDALVQVFLNLLRNAAEAAGPGGTIEIVTAYRHGLSIGAHGGKRTAVPIEISIVDDGPGAPPDIAADMFDAFVSSKRGGGGLGLALVAKIVADHRGHVEYERDEKRERTIMRVLLPRSGT